MASENKTLSALQLRKRAKKIVDWIDAYQTLVDLDHKYFMLSIRSFDKTMRKKYRQKSDQYHQAVNNLINLIP